MNVKIPKAKKIKILPEELEGFVIAEEDDKTS